MNILVFLGFSLQCLPWGVTQGASSRGSIPTAHLPQHILRTQQPLMD